MKTNKISGKPPQIRKLDGHLWEGRVIGHMPVEHVELVHLHQVQVVLEHRLGDVVPANIQRKTMKDMMMTWHLLVSSRIPRCVNRGESRI